MNDELMVKIEQIKKRYNFLVERMLIQEDVLEKLVRRYGLNHWRTRAMLKAQDNNVERLNKFHTMMIDIIR